MTHETDGSTKAPQAGQDAADKIAARESSAPLQLTLEGRCSMSVDKLFEAFTNPNLMCRIFPWMHDVALVEADEQYGGIGASRRCYFGNGLVLEETMIGWWPPNGYAFRVEDDEHPFGMRDHVGTIWFESTNDGSRITWKQYFNHSNPAAMRQNLFESMTIALNNVKTCSWQRSI